MEVAALIAALVEVGEAGVAPGGSPSKKRRFFTILLMEFSVMISLRASTCEDSGIKPVLVEHATR